MGLALGRNTGILHAGICDSCDDSPSGLEDDSAAGQSFRKQHDSFRLDGGLAVSAAVAACADTGRECRVEFLSDTAGVFVARDIARNVYVSPENQEQIVKLLRYYHQQHKSSHIYFRKNSNILGRKHSINGNSRQQIKAIFVRYGVIVLSADNRSVLVPDISGR